MAVFEPSMFTNRKMRAEVLNPSLHEEIEADPAAGRQAALVVVLASVAAGIGAGGSHGAGWRTFVVFTAIALATWIAWA